jgi:hypothetical protein
MKNGIVIALFTLTTLIFTSLGEISAQSFRSQNSGLYGLAELHFGYGLQGNVEPNLIGFTGITGIAGYSFTRSISVGAGTGIFAYNGSNAVPLFFEGGYSFREFGLGKMRFFLKADAGLLIRLNGDVAPARIFGNPLAGLTIPVANRKEISVSLGFFTQYDPNYSNQSQFANFLNAKIGLRFY